MSDKASVRSAWYRILADNRDMELWGKAAEKLRGLQSYRDAATVFATPNAALQQARINSLVDGKNLVMPSPSLRDGFYLLTARTVPFKNLAVATTYKGLLKNGRRLKRDAIAELCVGLLLTDALAVDLNGGRIGDGNGFFDLCCALLNELGGLQQNWTVLTFIREKQVTQDPLPQDPWDIKMTGAVTPTRTVAFPCQARKVQIFWHELTLDRIKRIDPLWQLYKAKGAGLKG